MQQRENTLKEWLEKLIGHSMFTLIPLAGDASFRRYFRLTVNGMSRIVMDAPPEKERLEPFIKIAEILALNDVLSPNIFAINRKEGFLLLEDFGDKLLLHTLNADNVNFYYSQAIDILFKIQHAWPTESFPLFNTQFIQEEISLCKHWFLQRYLSLTLTSSEEKLLIELMRWLAEQINQQPRVLIHRDYHSRNLMILDNGLGVIDFQDAMRGPLMYDLVSLLKDCYLSWPRAQVLQWLADFHRRSTDIRDWSLDEVIRAFDLCGLQRHLKVLGIFTRLYLRDNKPGYLQDLPLTLHYVRECAALYPELHTFLDFLQTRVNLP
ncbi:phosphotransferase [Legionella israelensis]|uniref:aminoglycoside phosphotransferase family protein n=1 Tax=Legionella israelensis TaxID=454 RepID=UPI00117C1A55|nr:phosphotransferase [Legionella israelensis]QDP71308.1 phosphotransferase [Legionella israelensis]